jgi:hypothetical protein
MARIAVVLSIIAVLLGGGALAVALTRDDDSAALRQLACLQELEAKRATMAQIQREFEDFEGNTNSVQGIAYCRDGS